MPIVDRGGHTFGQGFGVKKPALRRALYSEFLLFNAFFISLNWSAITKSRETAENAIRRDGE
jgi:hypothetical protein